MKVGRWARKSLKSERHGQGRCDTRQQREQKGWDNRRQGIERQRLEQGRRQQERNGWEA
jgi:hypothetical protein